jgi:hypothetical protein
MEVEVGAVVVGWLGKKMRFFLKNIWDILMELTCGT